MGIKFVYTTRSDHIGSGLFLVRIAAKAGLCYLYRYPVISKHPTSFWRWNNVVWTSLLQRWNNVVCLLDIVSLTLYPPKDELSRCGDLVFLWSRISGIVTMLLCCNKFNITSYFPGCKRDNIIQKCGWSEHRVQRSNKPSKHTTSFWRWHIVVSTSTTSYQRRNNVVCLLGSYFVLESFNLQLLLSL